jgi:hypothetical protein
MLVAVCFYATLDHFLSYGKMTQQIKRETGHVQFRVLRDFHTGQNSLHLSGSTPAHGWVESVAPQPALLRLSSLLDCSMLLP